jgi:hypothetical protein
MQAVEMFNIVAGAVKPKTYDDDFGIGSLMQIL